MNEGSPFRLKKNYKGFKCLYVQSCFYLFDVLHWNIPHTALLTHATFPWLAPRYTRFIWCTYLSTKNIFYYCFKIYFSDLFLPFIMIFWVYCIFFKEFPQEEFQAYTKVEKTTWWTSNIDNSNSKMMSVLSLWFYLYLFPSFSLSFSWTRLTQIPELNDFYP